MNWETVIGLEVHTQLKTKSKIFSGASSAYGAEPNTQACAVDIALPGVLPVMNQEAALMAIKFGLAIDAVINATSIFARKNYFYPDLPKGYQISQFELPIVGKGQLLIDTKDGPKTIGITRAHLEEDAGKSLHEEYHDMTGIDLNRAGTPLLEIVSDPDLRSAAEAVDYLKKLHALVTHLGICDGNMQEGSFRCDANVSVRPKGQQELGTRAELKNINSFKFVEQAIELEVERQIDLIEEGGVVVQETRLYDADRGETRSMRSKEEAHDYRYFPDPDLPPMVIDPHVIEEIKQSLPELPQAKCQRYIADYQLSTDDAAQLSNNRDVADYFESVINHSMADTQTIANWVSGELMGYLNKEGIDIQESPVNAQSLAQLLDRIKDKTISGKLAKQVFEALWNKQGHVDEIIETRGLKQITDHSAIEAIVDEILTSSPTQVEQYRAGEQKVLGYLVGQVMKASQGKANPQQVNQILRKKLDG